MPLCSHLFLSVPREFDNSRDDKPHGMCEPYVGRVCAEHIKNRAIYVTNINEQKQMEKTLSEVFTVINASRDITPICQTFAAPSLCYSSFPLCDTNSIVPKPRQVRLFFFY